MSRRVSAKARRRARRQRAILIRTIVCLFAVIMIAGFAFTMKASAARKSFDPYDRSTVNYVAYVVEKGDTLFGLASTYNKNLFTTDREYVYEVERANKMTTPDIFEGQLLLIPVRVTPEMTACAVSE